MKRLRILLPFAMACAVAAQNAELPGVRAFVNEATNLMRDDGTGLVVLRGEEVLHRAVTGALAGDTTFAIGPASKWLAVATILTLVDEGKLDLDVPVGRYVKEFQRADKQALTLRHCLANTGGIPNRLSGSTRGWNLDTFASEIADLGLREQPDNSFRHGELGLQIAAVAACRVTGASWHQLFSNRIVAPLNLAHTGFGAQNPQGADVGTTALPWLASGAVSTLDDYTAFLRMLSNRGRFGGKQVLSETSTAAMLRDQVPTLVAVHADGFQAKDVRYGLGTWIETLADGGTRASEPNSYGFTPWLDVETGIAGLFVANVRTNKALPQVARIQQKVAEVVVSPAVAGTKTEVTITHDGRDRSYELCLPPQASAKALPLLVVLHDDKDDAGTARVETGLAGAGTRAGYAVVFPNGTGPSADRMLTWNSGTETNYASERRIDDVDFVRTVVADVARRANVDASRVFAVGHGLGGAMCHRLAREAADLFAGVATYGGAVTPPKTYGDTPVAALLVHGTNDRAVRAGFGLGRNRQDTDAATQSTLGYYVRRNELVGYPQQTVDGKVTVQTFAKGRNSQRTQPVRLVTLQGAGHAWPGSSMKPRTPAETPFSYELTTAILGFFREVAQLPGAAPSGG
jgi:poly(3-hydroxybutyrate) depolymerase/CubicO group peptidase (beta-lactamase class C family)